MSRCPQAETHHRLLEGFVLRLARRSESEAFALRGGMLVRQWFPSSDRPALDLDLMCSLPFHVHDLRRRMLETLADSSVDDGVRFRPERSRMDAIWADTPAPGLRLFALGSADGCVAELNVDVTFGLEPWPAPEQRRFQAQRGAAWIPMSRPESIVGRKLQVIAQLGRRFRPKDVNDVRMLLEHLSLEPRTLGGAIEASLVGCEESLGDVRAVLARADLWEGSLSKGRWSQFLLDTGAREAPEDLSSAVASIRSHLRPILGGR